jgi:PAS domain S-box-containing protein
MSTRIERWFAPPVFPGDVEKTNQARTMNAISIYFALALIVTAVIFVPIFVQSKIESWAIILGLFIAYVIARHLMFRGQLELARGFIIVITWVIFQLAMMISGGITSPFLFSVMAVTIVIGVLMPARYANLLGMGSILIVLVLAALTQSNLTPPHFFKPSPLASWFFFSIILVFVSRIVQFVMQTQENALALARRENAAREHAEATLRASQDRNAALLRALPDLYFQINRDGVILDYHAPKDADLYAPPETFLGKNLATIMPPHVSTAALQTIETCLRAQEIVTFEYQLAFPEGLRVYENRIVPLSETSVLSVSRDITERKRANEELLKFKLGIERSAEAIFITDSQGVITYINPAFEKIYGYTARETIGQTPRLIKSGVVPFAQYQQFWAVLLSKGVVAGEIINKTKDGRLVTIEGSNNPILDADANIIGFLGVHRDITDRKRVDEQLRESEARFRAVVENSHDGIVLLNTERRPIYVSPSYTRISGYAPEEWIGAYGPDFIHPDDRALTARVFNNIVQTPGAVTTLEYRLKHKHGHWFWVETTATNLLHEPHIGAVVLNSHDITERKRAEEALHESETRFRLLVEKSSDITTILNLDGTARYESPAHEQILGYTNEEMIGAYPLALVHPDDLARLTEIFLQRINQPGFVSRFEYRIRHKDGTWREMEALAQNLIDDPAINGIIIHSRDITERKQREKELNAIATLSAALRAAPTRAAMLPVIVEQLSQLLDCASISIEIIDPATRETVVEGAYGPWVTVMGARQAPNTGLNTVISETRKPYCNNDVTNDPRLVAPKHFLKNIRAGAGVPLIAQDQLIGFLWMGRATDIVESDVQLLAAIADIAANAIHRATLHEQTQHAAAALTRAYDTTLEGWAHALELRDQETEGHTRRVVQMTLDLARAMGVPANEMENIRRGALLHDIGKMGVPDSVLLKPGSLNEREWEMMKRHPEYAYYLIAPIDYLRPVIDILYCHHEKWDGTGYPRGLVGDAIPLAARIFAIVDVWDALLSDRPYRKAWMPEQVLAHIRAQAGKHFDPRVVKAFLKLIGET